MSLKKLEIKTFVFISKYRKNNFNQVATAIEFNTTQENISRAIRAVKTRTGIDFVQTKFNMTLEAELFYDFCNELESVINNYFKFYPTNKDKIIKVHLSSIILLANFRTNHFDPLKTAKLYNSTKESITNLLRSIEKRCDLGILSECDLHDEKIEFFYDTCDSIVATIEKYVNKAKIIKYMTKNHKATIVEQSLVVKEDISHLKLNELTLF